MDSGFKNSRQSMTDWLFNRVDAKNKKDYSKGCFIKYYKNTFVLGGARGVKVIVVGNGHDDTSSNPGRD